MQIKIFKDLKQYTLTAPYTKADIELVKKYRPDALKMKDADGNDVFAVSYVEGKAGTKMPCLTANLRPSVSTSVSLQEPRFSPMTPANAWWYM